MRSPCCDKQETNRGAWSREEDQKLIDYIRLHGELVSWRSIPKAAGLLRCGKSCRLRWINYLRPDVKRGNFEEDEEDLIIKLHALLGNRWSLIAGRLPGRTDNEVKNHWNSHLRKRLRSMGVDPDNHRLSTHAAASLVRRRPPSSLSLDHPSAADASSTDAAGASINGLPDLNLELTISPPSSLAETRAEAGEGEDEATTTAQGPESTGTPITLFLFR